MNAAMSPAAQKLADEYEAVADAVAAIILADKACARWVGCAGPSYAVCCLARGAAERRFFDLTGRRGHVIVWGADKARAAAFEAKS